LIAELPTHTHRVRASSSTTGGNTNPASKFLGGGTNVYDAAANLTAMGSGTLSMVGGNQPHLNMQPFLTLSFCIALAGIFPSRN
jgi:microcystin-dependent protein